MDMHQRLTRRASAKPQHVQGSIYGWASLLSAGAAFSSIFGATYATEPLAIVAGVVAAFAAGAASIALIALDPEA